MKYVSLLLVCILSFMLVGCADSGEVTISKINNNPEKYEGMEVSVEVYSKYDDTGQDSDRFEGMSELLVSETEERLAGPRDKIIQYVAPEINLSEGFNVINGTVRIGKFFDSGDPVPYIEGN